MSFADLGLSDELMRAVNESGYTEPTAIQASAIPSVLMMRDLIGIAQTGTGKTASFVLPMIDILAGSRARARMPRSLILEPTRELAAQVAENFEKYGKYHKLSMALLIGGVQMGDQVKALEKGVDVLIATPGRLMDLFSRGKIMLNDCTLLVIDEADRMLDMGFIPDIEEICTKLPKTRQTLLFSATMPAPIKKLADKFLSNPKQIEVARPASTNLQIEARIVECTSRTKKDSLILEPTRELAAQVAENFEKYGKYHKLSMALLIGGVQMGDQVKALEKGVDVLIATPGRLMDLFSRGKIMLNDCTLLVIDEADRMLDMGFIPDIEEICTKLPKTRQTLLFSATMPAPIKKLADKFLSNPKQIEVARPASTNLQIEARIVECTSRTKKDTLIELLRAEDVTSAIIFSNRKTTVRELAQSLSRAGFKAGQIQGDMDQSERIRELDRFKSGDMTVLVASDVAARGLDVKGVSHVFNYDVPWHPDDYVHRIGRTGRAGAKGKAFTLATPDDEEAVANIEKLTGTKIERLGKTARAERVPPPAKPEIDKAAEPRATAKSERTATDRAPRPRAEPAKPARTAAAPKPRPAPAVHDDGDDDGGWNGPLPGFLDVKLG